MKHLNLSLHANFFVQKCYLFHDVSTFKATQGY